MRRPTSMIALATLACAPARPRPAPAPSSEAAPTAYAIASELDTIGATPLWPGFDPRRMPIAIHDGRETVLFRHPSPPPEFRPGATPNTWVHEGRHPQVSSNSSTSIAGVTTATLMAGPPGQSARERASIAAHESFHVFQRTRHPRWSANEAVAFLYPVSDARNLELRRVETEALRRALDASSDSAAACWTAAAMSARRERFAIIGDDNATYERASELNEGLASYVQARSIGRGAELPADDFPPDQVRARVYASGPAIAFLLDRLSAGWKDTLEARDSTTLDALVDAALARRSVGTCAIDATRRAAIAAQAKSDVAALATRRAREREAYLAQPGARLVVEADGAPLGMRGFDPLNVSLLTPTEILHTRLLELATDSSSIELLGGRALSTAAGPHPLFSGIRRLEMTGLAEPPVARDSAGITIVGAPGVTARFRGAKIERKGEVLIVRAR